MTTAHLDEVEAHSREICGYSEIDYERNKAAWLSEQPPLKLDPEAVLAQLDHFEAEARNRGVTHTTFLHITEALNFSGNQRQDLRELLINSRPEQYDAPLWRITTQPESLRPRCADARPHVDRADGHESSTAQCGVSAATRLMRRLGTPSCASSRC